MALRNVELLHVDGAVLVVGIPIERYDHRVLRAFHGVVTATLRSNYFQRDADGRPRLGALLLRAQLRCAHRSHRRAVRPDRRRSSGGDVRRAPAQEDEQQLCALDVH